MVFLWYFLSKFSVEYCKDLKHAFTSAPHIANDLMFRREMNDLSFIVIFDFTTGHYHTTVANALFSISNRPMRGVLLINLNPLIKGDI